MSVPAWSEDELIERFSLFDDWEERYAYLIELGRKLEPLAPDEMTEDTRVRGCVSQVWMVHDTEAGEPPRITLRADSDAFIVKGLVAILLSLYSGRTPEQMAAVDIERVFAEIGLDSHLTPNRRNGFFSMVERIRGLAAS